MSHEFMITTAAPDKTVKIFGEVTPSSVTTVKALGQLAADGSAARVLLQPEKSSDTAILACHDF